MQRSGKSAVLALRRRVYEILEQGSVGDRASRNCDRVIILLIMINLTAIVLESMPQFAVAYGAWFDTIEYVSLVAFTLEYGLRLWTSAEHTPFRHLSAWPARMRYATSAAGIVDLLAILPFWFGFLLPADARVLLVLRVIRFLKIGRYSPAMRSLLSVIYS